MTHVTWLFVNQMDQSTGADNSLLESQLKIISITVPKGLEGGDNVQFHEGTGVFSALIPPGLKAGDSFKVSIAGGDGKGVEIHSNGFKLASKPRMETVIMFSLSQGEISVGGGGRQEEKDR